MKILITMVMMIATQAMADDAATTIRWMENGASKSATLADVKNSSTPLFGYVHDLSQKQNLCYDGKDFEAVDLIYAGLNHHGNEICDSYFIVTAGGTLVVGPCEQPEVSKDMYSAEIPVCAAQAPTPTPAP